MNKKEVGGFMENLKLAYCNECEDLVEYDIYDELIEEVDDWSKIKFNGGVAYVKTEYTEKK